MSRSTLGDSAPIEAFVRSFVPSFLPSFRNDSKDKRVGLGGTLACGPIQALVTQRDTAGFRPVQPGSMRSATVPAMLSPAGTHQGHFSRDLIGICFGLLRAGKVDKWSGISSSQLPSFLPSVVLARKFSVLANFSCFGRDIDS